MTLASLLLAATLQYASPVHLPITLAGNFGEPRPNHFHGGIDIRTDREEGHPIFAVADGYVCRISVGTGYGNALFVRHPNGQTSVYAHLKDFVPELRAIVSRWRKEHGQEDVIDVPRTSSPVANIVLPPTVFPVAQGCLIAVSGNTGSSQAPHLHLEIRDTRTWVMHDPLKYLKAEVADTVPPEAHCFMAYPVRGQGVFQQSGENKYFPFTSHQLQQPFSAWGRVGFGIWADDHMQEAYQKYGIHHTRLTVDGEVVFESNVDSIPAYMNRMVNFWGDYDHYRSSHVWYMKSFLHPGNTLPFLTVDSRKGIVDFCEERDYHLEYTLGDVFGNESSYSFVVRAQRQPIPETADRSPLWRLRWDAMSHLQLPGIQLAVGQGRLADDIWLTPDIQYTSSTAYSDNYCLSPHPLPLLRPAQISLRLKQPCADPSKLFILCDGRSIGGTYHDGWITASCLDLGGTFSIGCEEEAGGDEPFV